MTTGREQVKQLGSTVLPGGPLVLAQAVERGLRLGGSFGRFGRLPDGDLYIMETGSSLKFIIWGFHKWGYPKINCF